MTITATVSGQPDIFTRSIREIYVLSVCIFVFIFPLDHISFRFCKIVYNNCMRISSRFSMVSLRNNVVVKLYSTISQLGSSSLSRLLF